MSEWIRRRRQDFTRGRPYIGKKKGLTCDQLYGTQGLLEEIWYDSDCPLNEDNPIQGTGADCGELGDAMYRLDQVMKRIGCKVR